MFGNRIRQFLVVALTPIMLLAFSALATAAPTPAGNWVTISDRDGKPRSVVRIWKSGSSYYGKIIKTYPRPGDNPKKLCTMCKGSLKNKPVIGMTIMRGVKQDARTPGKYGGGTILDPNNGKTYKVMLQLSPNGKTLKVRGYVGVSLFGRTQTWYRR